MPCILYVFPLLWNISIQARYIHRYKDWVLWNFSPVNEINGVSLPYQSLRYDFCRMATNADNFSVGPETLEVSQVGLWIFVRV